MNPTSEPTANPPAPCVARRMVSLTASVPASGPSGLSDYAVSPQGAPLALLFDEVRVTFLGRTSTADQQDPAVSHAAVGHSRAAIPESWVIPAHFYDVESAVGWNWTHTASVPTTTATTSRSHLPTA
jgi:site-specific DNA recombinase